MAGLGGRMSTVIKSKISRLLDKSEDPGETLDYGYQKQVELLQNVKKGIADVVTSKKRLQMQSTKLEQSVVKLDTQARQAISQGREDLARAALERKTVAQTELQSLDTQIKELESQQEQLTANEKKLRTKIETFRTKKEVIKAQYSAAEAQVKISEAANGVGEEMADLGLAIQRAEDKTEQMKARAGAVEELEAAGTFDDLTQLGGGQDDIDRELAALGAGSQVDDELSKMKAELGSGGGGDAPALEEEEGGSVIVHVGRGPVQAPQQGRRAPERPGQPRGRGRRGGDAADVRRAVGPDAGAGGTDGQAAGRGRARGVGRDPAPAGHHVRRGPGRVHRRRPHP